jgi:Tfp pilus assembly protein PilF
MRDKPGARECFERALKERPPALVAYSALARLYQEDGELTKAARLEKQAERYRQRNPYHLLAVARSEFADGNLDAARSHLKRAIGIKSDAPAFYELLIQVAEAQGRAGEAKRWAGRLQALATRKPDAASLSRSPGYTDP